MEEIINCAKCLKTSVDPISLVCCHNLCYYCAE